MNAAAVAEYGVRWPLGHVTKCTGAKGASSLAEAARAVGHDVVVVTRLPGCAWAAAQAMWGTT